MKKNFLKKLAFVLAAAVAVPAVAVPSGANAAATPDMAKRYANVYEGTSYSYSTKNVAAGHTVKWTVSGTGKDYVSLSKATGKTTTLTINTDGAMAAKNATPKITASVYDKKNKLVKASGDVVTIKVNASALDVKGATDVDPTAVPVNEAVKFNRVITPANATSVTYWSVTNKDGSATDKATITAKGELKVTEAGEYVVVAEARNAKGGAVKAEKKLDVTAGTGLKSVQQTAFNSVNAFFTGEMKDVKAADFSITRDDVNVVIPVKSVTVDKADAKKIVIETYDAMKDGKVYTVTYDKKKAQFTATDGKVASVNVSPLTITYDKETTINAETKDANGVVVDSIKLGGDTAEVEFSIETNFGYSNGEKLYLPEIGNTAKATVTYHTGTWDNQGNETGAIKQSFTITAVKDASTVSSFRYSISDKTPNWKTITSVDEKHAIAIGESNKNVYFQIKDSADNDVTANYKVESSDDSKLLVDPVEFDDDVKSAKIEGIKEGTAYILIKDKKSGTIVQSVPVTVRAEGKAVTMTLDTPSLKLSMYESAADKGTVKATVKNQYGDEMKISSISATSNKSNAPTITAKDEKTLEFVGKDFTVAGSYTYTITVYVGDKSFKKDISVTAVNPKAEATSSYELQLGGDVANKKVNVTVDADNGTKELDLAIVEKKNGVLYDSDPDAVKVTSVEVKKADGTVVATSGALDDTTGLKVSLVGEVEGAFSKNVETGTYKVTVKFTVGKSSYTKFESFTVEDKQAKASAVTKERSTSASDAEGVLTNTEYVQFSFEGSDLDLSAGDIRKISEKKTGNSVWIEKAQIKVTVDGDKVVWVPVTINSTFALNK